MNQANVGKFFIPIQAMNRVTENRGDTGKDGNIFSYQPLAQIG